MNKEFEALLKDFNKQTAANMLTAEQKALTNVNEVQLPYASQNGVPGIWTDCCLERPVLNLTLNPMRSLANRLPVEMSNLQERKYAFLTGIDEVQGTRPDAPCDEPQFVCDIDSCEMVLEKGRLHFGSKTIELDAIIEKLCRGVPSDLFLVGDVRGVSGAFTPAMLPDRNLIARGAVRRQMQLIGRAFQRDMAQMIWTGDPANNTANGGWKEFYGLSTLVADDYDTKPFVTGTNCEGLNSDIKDFSACIGEANATTGAGLYEYMQTLEETLFNKAMLMGYSNVEWKWVMHPMVWAEMVKYISCEQISLGCVTPVTDGSVQVTVNDGSAAQMQNELRRSMRLPTNGRTHEVWLDDGLPYTSDGGTPETFTHDMYFLPIRVDGVPVLTLELKDYRGLSQELSPVPGGLGNLHGWSESGRFLWTVRHNGFCFTIESKFEPTIKFIAPHLAGKVQNINVCRIQPLDAAFPPA